MTTVTTHLRIGGIFNNNFIANFLKSAPVKEFENWSVFDKVRTKTLLHAFLTRDVYYYCISTMFQDL